MTSTDPDDRNTGNQQLQDLNLPVLGENGKQGIQDSSSSANGGEKAMLTKMMATVQAGMRRSFPPVRTILLRGDAAA